MNKWDYYEQDTKVEETRALFEWSENCEYPSPASLFLDIIGMSEEIAGGRLCDNKMPNLGYLECDYLGDALKEYATNPQEVEDWVRNWAECE